MRSDGTRVIEVNGCWSPSRDSTQNGYGCPYTRLYGSEFGCLFKYGDLPNSGFPEWCPLKETSDLISEEKDNMLDYNNRSI